MEFKRTVHHRRSIRLPEYDYSQPGSYFITICTYERLPLFGHVRTDEMQLSEAGYIAKTEWTRIAEIRPYISLGEFVVMPNHLHGIVAINSPICSERSAQQNNVADGIRMGRVQRAPTVGDIVRGYKSAVTKRVRQLNESFDVPVWQRNYYEHIIRNENSHIAITDYIRNNPAQWQGDTYYV